MLRPIVLAAVLLSATSTGLAETVLDRLGAISKDGHLSIEADLHQGRVPATSVYEIEVQGSPRLHISAETLDGSVRMLHLDVENGRLIVRGRGLRPKVSIESLELESSKGITDVRFKGVGIWRPLVAMFGGIARSAVRKLPLRTDIPSVLKGRIIGGPESAEPERATGPPPEPDGEPAAPEPAAGPAEPSFLDLVTEVRILELTMTAFEGRPLALRPFLEFRTSIHPAGGEPMRLTVDKGVYRPGRDGEADFLDFACRVDGEIDEGMMAFGGDRSSVAHGRIQGGSFLANRIEGGEIATTFAASHLSLDLSSGHFNVPGGLQVELEAGSRFSGDDVRVTPAGLLSGVLDLDLLGRTGEFERQGAKLTTSNVSLHSKGLRVENNRATGRVELSFDYRLAYPFVVRYPIKEIRVKSVPLDFHGPFSATLELVDADTEGGDVRGDYVFKAPWPPIETAALAVLAAKWRQDLAIGTVDFALSPRLFRPCGPSCFQLGFDFTAERNRTKENPFREVCAPAGQAEIFIDKASRACILRHVRVQTHCKGKVGWVVNLVAPLLAKTYSDAVLLRMPAGLPLTVESVRGGADWIELGGKIDWNEGGFLSASTKPQ
jgi:hypothetical protein